MGHRHQEERDSKAPAKSRPIITDFDHEGDTRSVFSPALSPKNMLHLQRTRGNQAVLGLLSQQQKGRIQRIPDAPKKMKPPPSWARVSSNDPLPGEHVKGITDREAPIMLQDENGHPIYTEGDREKLKDALMTRHQENAQNGPEFAANFASALLEIWTGYVTEDMAETADDASWSMLTKLALFALKHAAISYLFPPAALSKLTVEVASVLNQTKYAVEAAADLGQDAIENETSNSKVQKRGKELRSMTTGLSANLQKVILSTFEEVGNSFYYQDWLNNASLQQLYRFRLPPALPAVPQEKIELMLAQQLTGMIHDQESTWIARHREDMMYGLFGYIDHNYVKNGIFVSASVDEHGIEQFSAPNLNAPKALREKLEGHTISEMPQVPLLVEFRCASPSRVYSKDELEAIEELEAVWPHSAPLEIKMSPDGTLFVNAGGLKEMFYLYSLVNPLADLGTFATSQRQCWENDTGLPLSPNQSAVNLYYSLFPDITDGARALYTRAIGPLEIKRQP